VRHSGYSLCLVPICSDTQLLRPKIKAGSSGSESASEEEAPAAAAPAAAAPEAQKRRRVIESDED
jgi:hypothetical protein